MLPKVVASPHKSRAGRKIYEFKEKRKRYQRGVSFEGL